MATKPNNWAYGQRETHLLNRYDLSEEAYQVLLETQNFRCKICGTDEFGGGNKVFCVDHNHKTGQIRGLLCHNCNILLGAAKDSQTTLLKAIQYLKGNI